MNNHHKELKEAATKAIDAVFADTSVGNLETRDSLIELRDEIEGKLDAIDADIQRDE